MAAPRYDWKVSGSARAGLARAPVGRLRLVGACRRWRVVAVALLAATLACLPRASQAGLWSADTVAAYGLEAELGQLRATRERMARRDALRRDLRRTVEELSREIVTSRRRGEQARAEFAGQGDALRAQELALDRVVPRLVARLRTIEQRRGQAARALADLASLSRRQELDPELRARLRAIGPVLLAVLRKRDAASAALAGQRDRLVERRQRLVARHAILHVEIERLRDARESMLEQRRGALQKLEGLDAELRRLARAGAALARPLLLVEAAHGARAEPDAARPAQDRARRVVAGDAVRGQAGRAGAVALASRAGMARAMTVAAVARAPEPWRLQLAPTLAVRQPLPHAARVPAGRHDRVVAAGLAGGAVTPLGRPVSIAMSVASLSSRVAPARLPSPPPIGPARAVAARVDGRGHEAGITIGAVPGQRVAAPQDGRIVFAGAFKSYGLLLIIEHDSEYHTLLWGFSKLRVAIGDEVRGGEIVGVMDLIDGVPPRLGVELRRRGRPVDPLPWLAASSSKVRG
jgi:murein DD-endopeptidase MepM/ murein hydrolase activator NlpD